MGNWKLILFRPKGGSGAPAKLELFDLGKDPFERTNLVQDHPEIVARGLAAMDDRVPSPLAAFNF
jgi:hypothetical protein